MKLAVAAFAAHLKPPVSRQRVYKWIERGDLLLEKKKIDTENPHNAAWLKGYPHNSHYRPAELQPTPPLPPPASEPTEDLDAEALLEQVASLDLKTMSKSMVDKIRVLEAALKTRVDRQHKRRELIERSLVQSVFGRLYQIDSNQWRTLAAGVAPEVAGMLGVEDPERILAVEQLIDDRVLRILGSCKRLLNESLIAWGAEGVGEG